MTQKGLNGRHCLLVTGEYLSTCAFGMEADKVQTGALFPGNCIDTMQAVFQKSPQEISGSGRAWVSCARAADPGVGKRCRNPCYRVVIQTTILFDTAFPVENVRLVPQLPVPSAYLPQSISLQEVFSQCLHQFLPASIVFGRIAPATVPKIAIGYVRRCAGECLWHKAQFHKGNAVGLQIRVKDTIQDVPTIDWG